MMNSDGTFKEDIQCIVAQKNHCGAIFVSNLQAACNPLTLKKHNIGAVITAIKGKNLADKIPKHVEYLYVPVVDHESCNISVFFKDSFEFIEEERKRTNVLVHCMAGVSRSVTLVIAYIMQKSGAPFSTAYEYVKSKRPIIHPNEAFVKQLLQHQKRLQGVNDSSKAEKVSCHDENKFKQSTLKSSNMGAKNDNMANFKDTRESWSKASSVYSVHLSKTESECSGVGKAETECGEKQNKSRDPSGYDRKLRQNIKKLFSQGQSRVCLQNRSEVLR